MARGRPVFTLPNFRAVQAARHDAHSSTMAAPEQQQEKKRTGSCLGRTVGSLIDGGVFGGAIGAPSAPAAPRQPKPSRNIPPLPAPPRPNKPVGGASRSRKPEASPNPYPNPNQAA